MSTLVLFNRVSLVCLWLNLFNSNTLSPWSLCWQTKHCLCPDQVTKQYERTIVFKTFIKIWFAVQLEHRPVALDNSKYQENNYSSTWKTSEKILANFFTCHPGEWNGDFQENSLGAQAKICPPWATGWVVSQLLPLLYNLVKSRLVNSVKP